MAVRATLQPAKSGSMLPLFLVMLTLLLAMAVFAVDLGYVSSAKTSLRAAVDAANLAGASGLNVSADEARKRAKDIAQSNLINGQPIMLQNGDIELGYWDASTNKFIVLDPQQEYKATAIRVTARMTKDRGNAMGLIFGPMIGFKTADLTVSAVAGFSHGADVVIVQDITSSFSVELADAKVGDQALIDSLYSSGTGHSSVGLVVHTGWGQTLSSLQDISANYTNLSKIISGIKLCGNTGMPACSGTDIASGLEEGIKVFNDSNYKPKSNAVKAIVLVSDGEPSVSSAGSHPKQTTDQLLALAQQQSDIAWAQGIHVYVVFFNRDGDQAAAAKVATLARGSGDFVQVTDPKQLPTALQDITKKLPMQLLK